MPPTTGTATGPVFQSVDEAKTKSISSNFDSIYVLGFASPGDGGAAIWNREGATDPQLGDLQFEDAANEFWVLSPDQVINPKMIGATSGSDASWGTSGDNIKQKIEALFAYESINEIYLPFGYYRIEDLNVAVGQRLYGPGIIVPLEQGDREQQYGATIAAGIKGPAAIKAAHHGGLLIGGAGDTPEGTYLQASQEGIVEFFPSRLGQPVQFQLWGNSQQGWGTVTHQSDPFAVVFEITEPENNAYDVFDNDLISIGNRDMGGRRLRIKKVENQEKFTLMREDETTFLEEDDDVPAVGTNYYFWLTYLHAEHTGDITSGLFTRKSGDLIEKWAGLTDNNLIVNGERYEVDEDSIDIDLGTMDLLNPPADLTDTTVTHRWTSQRNSLVWLTLQAARGAKGEMNITYYVRHDSAGIRIFGTNDDDGRFYHLPYHIIGEAPADDPYTNSGNTFVHPRYAYMSYDKGNVGIHKRDPAIPLHLKRYYDAEHNGMTEAHKEVATFETAYAGDGQGGRILIDQADLLATRLSIVSKNNGRAPAIQGMDEKALDQATPVQICIQPEEAAASSCHFGSWAQVPAGFRFKFTGNTQFAYGVHFPGIPTGTPDSNIGVRTSGELIKESSSIRYKTNVEPIDPSYSSRIWDLEPVYYKSRAPGDDPNKSYWGFVAEQVAEVDPRLVSWAQSESGERVPEGVQYNRICVLLLEELKRARDHNASLEERVQRLEAGAMGS